MKMLSGSVLTLALMAAVSPAFAQEPATRPAGEVPMTAPVDPQSMPQTGDRSGAPPTDPETGNPVVPLADTSEPSNLIRMENVTLDVPADYAIMERDSFSAAGLIGADIRTPDNESIAEIVDITLDSSGQITGIVTDVGRFLDDGDRMVMMDPEALSFYQAPNEDVVAYVTMTREDIEALPEYASGTATN